MPIDTVGVLLARARAEHGLSQRALACRLGVPQPTISQVETGARPLPTDWAVVEATAGVLDLAPQALHARLCSERGRKIKGLGPWIFR